MRRRDDTDKDLRGAGALAVPEMRIQTICLIGLLFLAVSALAAERNAARDICKDLNGVAEYALPDRTRVDCLTAHYAIEIEYPKHWAESIGQALYYAQATNRLPVVIFLMSRSWEMRYVRRAIAVVRSFQLPVQIFLYDVREQRLLCLECW